MIRSVEPWPLAHLEAVPICLVCGCAERELVYAKLTDVTFYVAKGEWKLWQCGGCGSGYLDPRPDEASIGKAYGSYYTHEAAELPISQHGLRHRLGNGYRNWRFGTRAAPSSHLGILAALLRPEVRQVIDRSYRYLPNPGNSAPRRLLDFGCGDGSFLRLARTARWDCFGVEPDPAARMVASGENIDVRATLEDFAGKRFDAVTLSHVIEHVHDPVALLRSLAASMERGAHLYIDTPNMLAIGHRLYGRHWRGLETPRHLILMTRASLNKALAIAGFGQVRYHDCPGALVFTQAQSRRIAAGADPYDQSAETLGAGPDDVAYAAATRGEYAEFLRITAMRA